MRRKTWMGSLGVGALLILTGCGTSNSTPSASGGGSNTIALLMPSANSASRWVDQDPVYFKAEVTALDPTARVIASNALGDSQKALAQVQSALTDHAQVLVADPPDATSGVSLVAAAHAANIPFISYDQLVNGPNIAFYVSFNNVEVGYLQGKYLVDHLPKGSSVVIINGTPGPGIAATFKQGVHEALDPAFKSGQLKLAYETDTPLWNPALAQSEMTQALTKANNNVQGVIGSNDGLAGGINAALTAQHLDGKVLVTGQDGTLAGLQRILMGTQSMTVFKDVSLEAKAAAKVAVALARGKKDAISSVAKTKVNNGTINVPALLLTADVVTKANVGDAVKAGIFTWAQICNGIPAKNCPQS